MNPLEIKTTPIVGTETDLSNLLWELATERDITKRKGLVEEVMGIFRPLRAKFDIPTIDMYCACFDCGYMGYDFTIIKSYFDLDCDVECPRCGSTDTAEPQEIMSRLRNGMTELDEECRTDPAETV